MDSYLRQHIEKIIPLTDEEFDYIFTHFTTKKYKRHQFIIQEDEDATHDYFILSGCLKSYFTNNNGKEHAVPDVRFSRHLERQIK